jgi:site-specific DNA recombinase
VNITNTNTKGKTAAIYARVSTQEQEASGTSLQSQVEACRAYAAANGLKVVASFEEAMSGATLNRPKLDRLREMVAAGQVDTVICFAVDRLSRDDTNLLVLAKELREHGCELKCATVPLQDTKEGKFLMSVLAAVAELDRASIVEKLMLGKRTTIRKGKAILSSARPYGFKPIYGEGRLEGIEDELRVVKRIFDWMTKEHRSLGWIVRRLNEDGVPTVQGASKGWGRAAIHGILKNPLYTGRLAWGKDRTFPAPHKPGQPSSARQKRLARPRPESEWIIVEGVVPRLISDEQFEAVREVLRRNKELQRRVPEEPYLLRGFLFCGECGARMRCHKNPNGQLCYQCTNRDTTIKHKGRKCRMADEIEADVWRQVRATLGDAEVLRTLAMQEQPPVEQESMVQEAAAALLKAKEKLAKIEQQADDLLDLFVKGTITKAQFEAKVQSVNDNRAQIESQIAEIEELAADYGIGPGQPHATLLDAAIWATLCEGVSKQLRLATHEYTFDEKRHLLELAKARISIFPTETRIAWVFTPAIVDAAPKPKPKPGEARREAIYHALVKAQTELAIVQSSSLYL